MGNLLLLGSVAFGVSFCLSLLINRDIKTALIAGFITVPATFSGVIAVNHKRRTQQHLNLITFHNQIHELEIRESQLNQSFSEIVAAEQRTKTNINFLKTESSQLYTQIAAQRSNKQQLSQDLITLSESKSKLEVELKDLQIQVQNCEKRRRDLYQSLQSLKSEKQNVPGSNIQAEQQLQSQIADLQQQKEEIERDSAVLQQLNLQLKEKSSTLQAQIQELEGQETALTQSLSALTRERRETELNLSLLQIQLSQLQTQVAHQNTKNKPEQELITPKERTKLKADEKQIQKLSDEWNEFMTRLPKYELQVLKAIAEQENTSAIIKKIAEENITMPELLIDFINKRALNTIGDLIVNPGNESSPPKILEEHLTTVKQVIKIKETN